MLVLSLNDNLQLWRKVRDKKQKKKREEKIRNMICRNRINLKVIEIFVYSLMVPITSIYSLVSFIS